MSETTQRAYARASYTIDLSGLLAHARDIFASCAQRRATIASRDVRTELPRSRVGPALRHYVDYGVPDSARIR